MPSPTTRKLENRGFKRYIEEVIMQPDPNHEHCEEFKRIVWSLAEWLVAEYQRRHLRGDTPPPITVTRIREEKASVRKLINIEELSKYLSVPKGTLYTDVCLRKIPAKAIVKLGRSLRFDKEAIDQWIEASRIGK
jgi:excisionase family DNA binding protein